MDITTARLRLVPMSVLFMAASLGGDRAAAGRELGHPLPLDGPGEAARFLGLRLPQLRVNPALQPWLMRSMILLESGEVAGHIGFHDAPDAEGVVEVGYTVFEPFRRRGLATEAARGLFDWAATQPGVTRFRASVDPANGPSLAVIAKLGMLQTGTQWDEEDGEELVFERPAP
ncbi:MAG: GNAT family N-acetyltransferase [Tepidiformaceae bacterium]